MTLYTPSGSVQDPAVMQELMQISRAISELSASIYSPSYAAPDSPKFGMLLLADGTNWDPLTTTRNQEYFVWYDGANWRALNQDAGGTALS